MNLISRFTSWLRYRLSLRRRGMRRSALVIVGCVTLAPAASLTVWGYGVHRERAAKACLERADQRVREGKPRAAAACLETYLRLKPTDGAVRARLADVYGGAAVTADENRRAIELYHQALRDLPEEEPPVAGADSKESELRVRLGELLLATQDYAAAESNADRLLAVTNKETDSCPRDQQSSSVRSQARRMRALAICEQFRRGSWKNGGCETRSLSEIVAEALESKPGDRALALILAEIYRGEPQWLPEGPIPLSSEERKQRADQLMEGLAQLNLRDCDSLLLVYDYQLRYHLPTASATLDAAIAADPKNAAVLGAKVAAECASARSASADARDAEAAVHWQSALGYCRQVLEAQAENETASADACEILLQLGDIDAAEKSCERGLSKNADSIRLNLLAAQILLERGRPREASCADRSSCGNGPLDKAERLLTPFSVATDRQNSSEKRQSLADLRERAALLRGRWHFDRGDIPKGLRILEQSALGGNLESARDANWFLADIYLRMGQPDHAAEHYEHVADLCPRTINAYRAAAGCWENAGCLDAAERNLRRALAIHGSTGDWCALGRVLLHGELKKRRAERRWEAFDEAMAHSQEAGSATDSLLSCERERLAIRAAYFGERDVRGAAVSRERALQDLHALEGKHTESPALLAELTWDYEALQASAEADKVAAELRTQRPQEAEGYLLEARLANHRGEPDRARASIAMGIGRVAAAERSPLECELVALDLADNRRKAAETRLETLIDSQMLAENIPLDGACLNLAVNIAERAAVERDDSSAEHWERLLLKIEGRDGTLWRYARARRLLETAENIADLRFAEASRLQLEIGRTRPSWARGYLLAAVLLERRDLPEEAADACRDAIRLGWRQPTVYEALTALDPSGRYDGAERFVAELLGRLPDSQAFSAVDRRPWLPGIETARRSGQTLPHYRTARQDNPNEAPIVEN
jgi:tetratricopeptide (TPR) repeat protein